MSPSPGPTGRKITERLSDEALTGATGRNWASWFALLDAWDATGRNHTAIARHLVEAHGVNGWHAQSIAVGYEQERGMRQVGQASDGGWKVSASKTVDAPAERCTAAFADEELRRRWLPDGELEVRTHRPGKSLTADWDGGTSRIEVYLTPKGETKTQIGLGHTRLPDADAVAAYKQFWRERLADLKPLLETEP
ncbi:hypothetical protein ACF09C_31515 [Streptomyces sp. NPDC014870]|uniref:hypothetical protein n=1 Tax=Streptomyces sp. NPDC014870 TaxID=3364925 RepID=UPI0036F73E73